jgi:hypothetical protein
VDRHLHRALLVLAGGLLLAGGHGVFVQARGAQLPNEITAVRFNRGQSVVPYFEGWIKNADGTFDMVFGYFNRNHEQEFAIPPGPDNRIEPGPVDAGQPTYFLPRRQRYVFRVRVPADFGDKEMVWTITANGRTEKGYGTLIPQQEITERVVSSNGNYNPGHDDPNKPPSLTLATVQGAAVGTPLTLTALVKDDGLPKRRAAPPPPAKPAPGGFGAQVNTSGAAARGLNVTWLQYRGPARISFTPAAAIPVTDGQAATTVRFAEPGTYKLFVTASDGGLSTKTELTITVAGPRSSP